MQYKYPKISKEEKGSRSKSKKNIKNDQKKIKHQETKIKLKKSIL